MAASTQRREFLQVQSALESGPGVENDTATAVWAALTDIRYRPDTTVIQPQKLDGSLSVSSEADVVGKAGHLQVGGYLSFEEILYYLEMGYKTVSPSGDAGSPNIAYSRVYAPTLLSADTPATRTLKVGTNHECFILPYSFLESLEFSARIRDYTTFQAVVRAQDYKEGAFTGSLTRRTVERVLGQNWQFYIDDAALGAMGGTNITDCVTDFTFRSGPLYMWANCMNGSLLPETHIQQGQKPELMITFQLSNTTLQLLRDYQAGTKKYLRIRNLGHNIHGTGVVTPPGAVTAAAGAAGDLTGDYLYKATFVYADGGESALGTAMGAAVTLAAQKGALSAIPTGTGTTVARRLYRTVASGSVYKYLTTITDNTTTVYTDDAADSSLGVTGPATASEYIGPLVQKMLQVDLCANILQFPDVGQAQAEGALSIPITFSGSEDIGGSWGKLVEYTVRNRLASIA
jgi:hypothetical protein